MEINYGAKKLAVETVKHMLTRKRDKEKRRNGLTWKPCENNYKHKFSCSFAS